MLGEPAIGCNLLQEDCVLDGWVRELVVVACDFYFLLFGWCVGWRGQHQDRPCHHRYWTWSGDSGVPINPQKSAVAII